MSSNKGKQEKKNAPSPVAAPATPDTKVVPAPAASTPSGPASSSNSGVVAMETDPSKELFPDAIKKRKIVENAYTPVKVPASPKAKQAHTTPVTEKVHQPEWMSPARNLLNGRNRLG